MQQQMVQQAAFAQIPDVVKRVSTRSSIRTRTDANMLAVYRPLPPSCPREQPRRNHRRLRERLESVDREVLRQNRVAGGRSHRTAGQRWSVAECALLYLIDIHSPHVQTKYS